MSDLVEDDMLAAFAVVGPPGEIGAGIARRISGVVDRTGLYLTTAVDPDIRSSIVADLRDAVSLKH